MTSLLTPFPAPMAATVLVPQQLITCGTTRNCVRMRGLPMEATVADILSILGDCSRHIALQGIHLIFNPTASPLYAPLTPLYLRHLKTMKNVKTRFYPQNKKKRL